MTLRATTLEVFVATTDPARARSFYEGALGLPLLEDNGYALLFAGSNATIRVTHVPELDPADHTVLGWVVDDIGRTVDALVARGVTLADFPGMDQDDRLVWTAPGGTRVAWFRDPDGNTLSISQPARDE